MKKQESQLFAALLKYWRTKRGLSQLDLALTADVSARHISFLETGRARPSRDMVLVLAATLDLPLRERNALLREAGFAEAFEMPPLDALADDGIRRALTTMMHLHEPFPMLVMDKWYEVLEMNQGAQRLVGVLLGPQVRRFNACLAFFDELRPFVVGWEGVARLMIARLHREALHQPHDERMAALLRRVLDRPDLPDDWRRPDLSKGSEGAFTLRFKAGDLELAFVTTLMAFNAPQNVTLDELRIECYYPLDEVTEAACRMASGPAQQ
ncbi:MAG: helix-turn-helix transcriptional regulator [Bacteroidota bacterium]